MWLVVSDGNSTHEEQPQPSWPTREGEGREGEERGREERGRERREGVSDVHLLPYEFNTTHPHQTTPTPDHTHTTPTTTKAQDIGPGSVQP